MLSKLNDKQSKANQVALFKNLLASEYMKFKTKTMALLYSLNIKMRERNMETRLDYDYPFDRMDVYGNMIEVLEEPPMFEVSFYYQRSKKLGPVFRIFAIRIDKRHE